MITTTYGNPTCPYCQCNKCTMGYGDYFCTRCGAEFDMSTACRMYGMNPINRAERIGDHHARDNWDYLWCAPEFTREELGAYARGFLSACYTTGNSGALWLHEERAREDAGYGPRGVIERAAEAVLTPLVRWLLPKETRT